MVMLDEMCVVDDCCPKGRINSVPLRGADDYPACGPEKVGTAFGGIRWEKRGE
jgi:hypothetical protein